jgi:hypothetical protein
MNTEHPHPGGFVPRLGADPGSARYELLTADQAAERVAAVGFDPADAQLMVAQYLAQNTAAFGPGPGDGWRVDPFDLAEIARGYEWVDHYRGETIADARARAASYAAGYQQQAASVDRERDPGRAARVDREAVEWAERARDGHNPWPAPDPRLATADGAVGDLTADQEHAAVQAVTRALDEDGDGDGNWDGDGDQDDAPTPEQAARSERVTAASWAVAARDLAIERGETEHAIRFAQQAREAIAAVEGAGVTREQLAHELDYPGGAAELDGEHIEAGIESGRPHTAAHLAVLDGAWNEAMGLTPATPSDDQSSGAPGAAGAAGVLVMPTWMAEQARATQTAIAAGTHSPLMVDDPAEITARIAALHAQADHDEDGDENSGGDVRGCDDGPRPVPLGGPDAAREDTEREDAEREEVPGAAIPHADHQPGGERDEAGAGRDDPAAAVWWEPIGTGEVTLSHAEVVDELTRAGMTGDQARDALTRYLDDTSREVGVSVHRWGLDLHDVEAIAATDRARQVVESSEQRDPARGEWEQVRGADPRSYDQMMGDAAAALTARPAASVDVEDQRREQLIRWHGDDHTSAHGHGDDGAVRALDDHAPAGAGEEW